MFLLLGLFGTLQVEAAADSLSVSEDLSLRFFKYEAGGVSFVSNTREESNIGFYIYTDEGFDVLRICDRVPFTVWLDGDLVAESGSCFEITKAELLNQFNKDTLVCSILSRGSFNSLSAEYLTSDFDLIQLSNTPMLRGSKDFQNWLIIGLLLLIGSIAIFKHLNPTSFARLFAIRLTNSSDDGSASEFTLDSVWQSLFLSMIVGFNYLVISLTSSNTELVGTLELFFNWSIVVLIVLIFLFSKYIVLILLSSLNQLGGLVNFQYHDFLRFFSIASVFLLIILQFFFWFGYYSNETSAWFLLYFYLITYALFIIYYFRIISKSTGYKKLHIISYLCTSEFIGAFLLALIIYK